MRNRRVQEALLIDPVDSLVGLVFADPHLSVDLLICLNLLCELWPQVQNGVMVNVVDIYIRRECDRVHP